MNKDFFRSTTFKRAGYKALFYGSALFLLTVAQITLFAHLSLFGATPDLLLAATVTLSMCEGEKTGALAGIGAGFLSVALGAPASPIYIVFCFLCGYAFGMISDRALSKNFPSFIALSVFAYLAKAVFNIIEVSLSAEHFNLFSTLSGVVVPELFCSILLCSPIYFIFRALTRPFDKGQHDRREFLSK